MARGATTQNLFLQISGSADGLQRAAKVAKTSLAELGAASGDLQQVVADNFRKLGGGDLTQSARQLESTYRKTFANIRAAAEDTLSKPMTAGSIVTGNVAAAEQQLTAARATALAYRELADAQTRMVSTSTSVSAGERELAVVLETQALAAKEDIVGIEQRIAVLRRLQSALGTSTEAEGENAAAHTRMGASGMIAEHVIRSFSDSVAAGQSPVRALGMEMGRITEAMTMFAAQSNASEGALGKFAGFMGGPWGLAISVAVAALIPLTEHLLGAGDASDSLKGKVLTLADALSAEKFGTEAATKALQEYNAEKRRADDNDSNAAASHIAAAQRDIQAARARRDQYLAEAQNLRSRPDTGDEAAQASRGMAAAALERKAAAETSSIRDAEGIVRSSQIDQAKEAAKAATDPIEAIRQKYLHMSDAATEAARANDKLASSLAGLLTKYAIQEAAEIKVAEAKKAAERTAVNDNRQSGRQVTVAQAEGIVQGIGGRVTSSYRSTAEQQVLYDRYKAGKGPLAAKPGTSEHERGQALDVAKSAGMTLAKIVEAFAAQGVHLTERLDEGDHYHVAWGAKGPKGPSSETLAKRQQAATRKDANDDRAFQGQLRQAQSDYSQAMLGLSTTAQERYAVSITHLRTDLDARDKALDDQVTAGSLSSAEALQLKVINGMTEQLMEQRAKREEMNDLLDQQLTAARTQIQSDLALIQLRQQGAVGRPAQYKLAQDALAKQQEENRDSIAQRINNFGRDPQSATAAVQESQSLPEIEAQQRANLSKQYQSPLDSYKDQLKANVGDMGDALQGVAVDGLKGLEDGLQGLISGTESVSGAFKKMATSIIADLARIAIEKAILGFFGLKDGGLVPGLSSGGLAGFAMGGLPGFARGASPSRIGNRISGAGTGTSDSILALVGGRKLIRVANGEGIANERAVKQWWPIIDQMNKGTFRGFAAGGLPSGVQQADLSPSDMRSLSSPRSAVGPAHILVQVEEGALFRPVVSDISARHAQAAIIAGANQAAEDRHDDAYSAIPQ
ncbi:M15 family metallopeptidase [Sphingomonas abietis]|uniref:M15 family metallopeptidase n=1 Tax=Sphingomonas abietis TaxID=3012344 RepID=A0ABY7NQV1_9SPHN|nr:M15 family metallopeptidase [Sphingomonas abietis]WBO23929.1 M15 family metallopeptidase [Sphingomonas abietis]